VGVSRFGIPVRGRLLFVRVAKARRRREYRAKKHQRSHTRRVETPQEQQQHTSKYHKRSADKQPNSTGLPRVPASSSNCIPPRTLGIGESWACNREITVPTCGRSRFGHGCRRRGGGVRLFLFENLLEQSHGDGGCWYVACGAMMMVIVGCCGGERRATEDYAVRSCWLGSQLRSRSLCLLSHSVSPCELVCACVCWLRD